MIDFEIRESIRRSAENVEVPENLEPDRIEERWKQTDVLYHKNREKNVHRRRNFYIGYAAGAAVFLAVCCITLFWGNRQGLVVSDSAAQKEAVMQNEVVKESELVKENEQVIGNETAAQEEAGPGGEVKLPKEDAGGLYRVASDYHEVYDAIVRADYVVINDALTDMASIVIEESSSSQEKRGLYSATNLQTEGVDESDIVKTDGACLYIISNNRIHILDITEGKPQELTSLSLPTANASSDIVEIYVTGNRLFVIAEEKDTLLTEVYYTGEGGSMNSFGEGEAAGSDGDVKKAKQYRTSTTSRTSMYTYSLENPAEPILLGTVSVDGYYYTSRKIGDIVYLFTDEMIGEECYGTARDSESWIPLAGGERVAADCIYIPESGSSSLMIASVDVEQPETIVDNVMIVNNSVDIYVSTEAVYLYHTQWGGSTTTEIAKFSLQNGVINAVGAASVKGRVQDTFAVNESQGMLRILTCSDSTDEGSSLYILDDKLALIGKLEGIAPGETVYAARYLGDMAYFVTYRNIDPLFAANLSDPANPVIMGELKISGYSDYLHMWTDGKMFGIGYETDPDTGSREGIKLSMFDISDPVNLSVSDSVCITNADYSPALSQYKTVLGDVDANLIGFVVTEYDRTQKNTYLLYQWKDGKLENLLATEIGDNAEIVRGLHAGDYFYIVTQQSVEAFSRTNGYEKVGAYVLYK